MGPRATGTEDSQVWAQMSPRESSWHLEVIQVVGVEEVPLFWMEKFVFTKIIDVLSNLWGREGSCLNFLYFSVLFECFIVHISGIVSINRTH